MRKQIVAKVPLLQQQITSPMAMMTIKISQLRALELKNIGNEMLKDIMDNTKIIIE